MDETENSRAPETGRARDDDENAAATMPRSPAALIAAVPIILVNTLAVIGQCQWAGTHLHWGHPGQALFAGALETTALAVMYLAHTALIEGDSAWRQKTFAYLIAAGSASVNWQEHAAGWHPTPAAFVFAGASLLSPILWATYSRFAARTVMREAGLIDRRAAKFSFARWLMFPRRTFKALRYSVWHSVQSPAQAIAGSHSAPEAADNPTGIPKTGKQPSLRRTATAIDPGNSETGNTPVDDKPVGNPGAVNDTATRQPAAADNTPAAVKREPRQPAAPKRNVDGQPSTDTWVEIGKPVYDRLRAELGKRPGETVFHGELATLVAKLIADGELVGKDRDEKPDAYADPSLSTAKRIRGEIETRFPGIIFGRSAAAGQQVAIEEVA